MIEVIYTHEASFVAQCRSRFRLHCVLFRSRIVNCSQEETFGNLLSRLEEDKFSASVAFILPATWVYFVIKLAQATKHQVGLAL